MPARRQNKKVRGGNIKNFFYGAFGCFFVIISIYVLSISGMLGNALGFIKTVQVSAATGIQQSGRLPVLSTEQATNIEVARNAEDVINSMKYVIPANAIPGDVFITDGQAYMLFKGGVVVPFGCASDAIKQVMNENPGLADSINYIDAQPGDIYEINDSLYILLGGGWSLVCSDTSGTSSILTPATLQDASLITRARPGEVPENTKDLKDAQTVLRIRQDVQFGAASNANNSRSDNDVWGDHVQTTQEAQTTQDAQASQSTQTYESAQATQATQNAPDQTGMPHRHAGAQE